MTGTSSKFSDLPKRIGTAVLLICILAVDFYFEEVGVAVLAVILAGLLGFEAAKMAKAATGPAVVFGATLAVAVLGIVLNALPIFGAGVLGMIVFTMRFLPHKAGLAFLLGILAISGLSAAFLLTAHFNVLVLILILVVTAFTDIGGYLIGRVIGGPKFAPRISPGKTWSGVIGALVLGGAASVLSFTESGTASLVNSEIYGLSQYGLYNLLNGQAFLPIWAAISIIILVITGDLAVSLIKRGFGAKDSSKLLPGHGGLWDRFDGFCFGVIGFWVFAAAGVTTTL
ncbi:MAG: phosphatidate cytidylyltransferase [Pseudomonadota bacterium]